LLSNPNTPLICKFVRIGQTTTINKKMKKIEHIGIAVKNMAESHLLFEKLLGVTTYKSEEVQSESVFTTFFKTDTTKIELIAATQPESAIAKFIEKKGEGIHHIAFEVEDLETEIIRLKKEGFVFVDETPKKGADNKRIVFLYPKNTNGVLIELCQEIK
jgi:methylmalonyl-CoA/ethylmalonyl-CoA epimerase